MCWLLFHFCPRLGLILVILTEKQSKAESQSPPIPETRTLSYEHKF